MTARPLTPITLYALHLNPESKGLTDRFAVMRLDESGDLVPLWGAYVDADPGDDRAWNAAGRTAAKAWPNMVYSPRPASGPERFPAFHFALRGYGYSKLQDLAESLARAIRYPVELRSVTGWRSSLTRGVLTRDVRPVSRKAALAKLAQREG